MIDGRNFFGQPVGNNMKTYENIWKNTIVQDDYTTGCLLDYPYFKEDYKLNATDLSKHQALDPNQKQYSKSLFLEILIHKKVHGRF